MATCWFQDLWKLNKENNKDSEVQYVAHVQLYLLGVLRYFWSKLFGTVIGEQWSGNEVVAFVLQNEIVQFQMG